MKAFYTPYIYVFFLLLISTISNAQSLELDVKSTSKNNSTLIEKLDYKRFYDSKPHLLLEINSIKTQLAYKGFLNTKLDSIALCGNKYTAYLNLGKPTKSLIVKYSQPINLNILKKYTYKYSDSSFIIDFTFIEPLLNDLTNNFEEQGRSFTQLKLKNIDFNNNIAIADLVIIKSKQRHITGVILKNYTNFPKTFLKYYLDITPNDIFNKEKISLISNRIKYLNFVTEIKPAEVLFTNNKTNVYLYLKKNQTNTLDGLIGFSSNENGKGILFNGYLNLNLVNAFNTGETLSLFFKNNGLSQQKFDIGAKLPYIFKSKFTINGKLNIYKQDSSYINVNTNLAVQYPIKFNSNLGLTIKRESSSNLLTNQLHNVTDYNSTYFGISYNYNLFNDDLNFDKIFTLQTHVLIGTKSIGSTKNNQYLLDLTASYILPLNSKNAIFIKSKNAFLSSSNYLTNELFRLGGYNSIRGFKEESIFASKYSILNLEYRYKTNLTTYLYSITDFGIISNPFLVKKSKLYSFGIGYKFRIKNTIIDLSYAFGGSKNHQIKLNEGLIHLNIKTMF